jgi:hypothetical protein
MARSADRARFWVQLSVQVDWVTRNPVWFDEL